MGKFATGKDTYTKEDLWNGVLNCCDKKDKDLVQFRNPEKAVIGMIFLYSVMEKFGIEKLSYHYTNGNCEGILIHSSYWE